MKNNPGINGWAFDLTYDNSVLELVSCDASDFGEITTSNQLTKNPYHVQWYHLDDVKTNGEMCKIKFNVKQNAKEGKYTLAILFLLPRKSL